MSWQPSASVEALKLRADLNAYIRQFFAQRFVMEVETPVLSAAGVSDASLEPVQAQCCDKPSYLHTSPEYPMKRLLAAGSGDIYQICKTFRDQEKGSRHNPEFTMLEYYRLGFDLKTLMDEVAMLVGDCLNVQSRIDLNYQDAIQRYAHFNVFSISDKDLRDKVTQWVGEDMELNRDGCLDLIMSYQVEPNLPKDCLVFIRDYPASQAALARTYINADGIELAQRFELYVNGLELANGYHELADVAEQKRRFEIEAQKSGEQRSIDGHFIMAIESGLPECSGVAIGLDRILMLKHKTKNIADVLSFSFDRA